MPNRILRLLADAIGEAAGRRHRHVGRAGAANWSGARRGLFYRPVKQQLTLRLDADVIAWFEKNAGPDEGHQTRINRVLRSYVEGQARRGRRRA